MNSRLPDLKKLLVDRSTDAALISSIPNIIYLTNFSHFIEGEREAFLLITPKNQYIFTDARYSYAVQEHVKDFILQEISVRSSLTTSLKKIIGEEHIVKLGIESDDLTVAEFRKISPLVKDTVHFDLSQLRKRKDTREISLIRKACEIGDKAFEHILLHIKPGITEKKLMFELDTIIRKTGHDISFPSIIAFEENAAIPHHKTGHRKLTDGELILMDFGVKYDNYCSDMTRTIFFGKATEEKKRMYQTVLDAQQKAIEYIQKQLETFSSPLIKKDKEAFSSPLMGKDEGEGENHQVTILASEADKTARDYILSQNYPSIPHSLGHGIGLQVHESPTLSPGSEDLLTESMVFSIEPGIYLPDHSGIRLEDLFTIQNNQLVQLTKSPKRILEL